LWGEIMAYSRGKMDGMHFNPTTDIGLVLGAIIWGVLHGLTPHGHSWLVLLPFALGGITRRGMLRMSLVYSLGMIVAAAGTGALLGLIFSIIPGSWHHVFEVGVGVLLVMMGLIFLLRPLSVHHAIDHICGEECQSGEEKALLRSGTAGAMFMLGVMSMIIPCPTNIWVYMLPAVTQSPLKGTLIFTIYAIFTALAINLVAVSMVHARGLVAKLDQSGYRLLILRLSGILVLGIGLWWLWQTLGEQRHEQHPVPALPMAQVQLVENVSLR